MHRLVHLAPRPGHQVFKNWDPYVNAAIDLPTALAMSCDTYFYRLGDAFYGLPASVGHPLQAWASSFGFGRRPASTSAPEAAACCRRPSGGRRRSKTDAAIDKLWKPGDSIQLAIGQKDLLVTPLQMARFYALIANGGKLVTPHLLLDVEQPGRPAAPHRHPAAPAAAAGRRHPAALEVVQQGLSRRRTRRSGPRRRSSATSR